jgi:hypothetical protein
MKRWMLAVVVGSSLACGGLQTMVEEAMEGEAPVTAPAPAVEAEVAPAAPAAGGGGGSNVAACKKYVETVNAAECMAAAKMDAEMMCNPALDQMPCDLSKYYTCLAENTKCNGPVPDLSGLQGCGAPTCPM